MRLYDFSIAPSPQKVRIFVAEKGIDLPVTSIDLRAKEQHSPEFLGINPSGTVPVLVLDDGTKLTESLAICHYLEQCYPNPNLMGEDATEQALVLMWNDILTLEGYLAVQEVLRNSLPAFEGRSLPGTTSYEQIPALVERGRKRAALFFDRLEARLGESSYLASQRFTYADIVGYVYTGFAARVLDAHPAASRPRLRAWCDSIAERASLG